MASNYLEKLAAEWYEYQGYFIRRNDKFGIAGGGYNELDIVAFNPKKKHLVHIEAMGDASTWKEREERYRKKFNAGKKYIPQLFPESETPNIEQIVLLGFGSNANHQKVGGGTIITFVQLIREIIQKVGNIKMNKNAIPEKYPILRTLQLLTQNKKDIIKALSELGT